MTTKKELIEKIKNTFPKHLIPKKINLRSKQELKTFYDDGIRLKVHERKDIQMEIRIYIPYDDLMD